MRKFWVISLGIIIFFTIAYSLLVLHKYWQFEYFFQDNVYMDTALWKVANFEAPIVRHTALGEINLLGDHFEPTIFILSPLYRLFPFQETILLSMVFLYSLTGLVALLVAQKLIKTKYIVYCLLIAYFLYRGTQNAFLFGFHDVSFIGFFFMLSIYFLISKKTKLFILSIVLLLLSKESTVGIVFGISIFMFLTFKEYRRLAILLLIAAIGYYFLVTKLLIPQFSGGRFLYGEFALGSLVNPFEKVSTFFISMASFGFLPLLSGAAIPLAVEDFLVRYLFAKPGNVQYTLNYHYGIVTASLMLFSSLWAVHKFETKSILKKLLPIFAILVLVFSLFFHRFTTPRGPLEQVFNADFYKNTQANSFLWELVEKTPKAGKIMTQNHLGFPLSHTDVYPISTSVSDFEVIKPDHIVVDLRDGQNPNNFSPITESRTHEMITLLKKSGRYKVYFTKQNMIILSKIKESCSDIKNPYCRGFK